MSQHTVAAIASCNQSRISAIENGHVPKRSKWPQLLKGFGLEGQEAEFYRMIMNAQKLRAEKKALQRPVSETHPLFALAQNDQPAQITPLDAGGAQKAREA